MTDGIILVATKNDNFYRMAVNCANSILEFMPDAKISLFTEPQFVQSTHSHLFDTFIEAPSEYRAKLWAMANTPYDRTFYMDVDMEVIHEDFKTVFDHLGSNDMCWTRLTKDREYAYFNENGSNLEFPGGQMKIHGGVCLYNRRALKFMDEWYQLDKKIRSKKWWPNNHTKYPVRFKMWDQFSLWWLTNKEWTRFGYLNYDFFENDARWNHLHSYTKDHTDGQPPIIYHYDKNWSGYNFT